MPHPKPVAKRRSRHPVRRAVRRGTALALGLIGTVHAAPNAAAERGHALYATGRHANGDPVTARSSDNGVTLPPAFVACEQCHGYDARGKTEAGVTVSDIRWETLTKPYLLARSDGRERGPYDERLFFAAVTTGRDSRGQPLAAAMPRYELSETETADLAAYLKIVDSFADQGVTDSALRLGVALPSGADAKTRNAERLLGAWAERLNRKGGIYRRRVEWIRLDPARAGDVARVVVALVADGADPLISAECDRQSIPYLRCTAAGGNGPTEFALRPDWPSRAHALASYAAAHGSPAARISVIYPANWSAPRVAALAAALPRLSSIALAPLAPDGARRLAQALKRDGVSDAALVGAAEEFTEFLQEAGKIGWTPLLLFADARAAAGFAAGDARAVSVQWALPADTSAEVLADFKIDPAAFVSPSDDADRQQALLASCGLLAAAFENAGREVGRRKLVDSLENLHDVKTGFGPPAGFSPHAHTATAGFYIASLPRSRFQPAPEWMPMSRQP